MGRSDVTPRLWTAQDVIARLDPTGDDGLEVEGATLPDEEYLALREQCRRTGEPGSVEVYDDCFNLWLGGRCIGIYPASWKADDLPVRRGGLT